MKIRSFIPSVPKKLTEFENGHLYRHKNADSYNDIEIYACGYLIDLVTGKKLVRADSINPETYEDVTDEYTLVSDTLLEREIR